MKVVYIINISSFFHSHFFPLARHMQDLGHEIHLIVGDNEKREEYESLGFNYHEYPMSRKGLNLFSELNVIHNLYKLLKTINPDLIHAFTAKPVLYSALLCKVLRSVRPRLLILSVTGLGSISLSTNFLARCLWFFIKSGYRWSFSESYTHIVFENSDDQFEFISQGIVPCRKTSLVWGAGLDTSLFKPKKVNNNPLKVVFVGRILKDKGSREYIEAAKILDERKVSVCMCMVGPIDKDNISSLTLDDIPCDLGNFEYLGKRSDILDIYQNSDIACLPSYREGLPKSLIEAASCGLPIITTDTPGCRQMINPESKNGILVEVGNAEQIASAVEYLVNNPQIRCEMGTNSRKFALNKLDYSNIHATFDEIYQIEKLC